MLAALLMTTMLAGAPQAQAKQVPTQAEAEALARQGDREAALRAFQSRASANPDDLVARLWIARLHEQMGHPELAEPVYRSVMLESTDNLEAILGMGRLLLSAHRPADAVSVLNNGMKLAPRNADLLSALGEAHLQLSNKKLAFSYLDLAAEIDPTPERRRAAERAGRKFVDRTSATPTGSR